MPETASEIVLLISFAWRHAGCVATLPSTPPRCYRSVSGFPIGWELGTGGQTETAEAVNVKDAR